MTRHARNCTAGTVYTYHERKKDTVQSGYGNMRLRLGKDSIKEFDCCCLTLQPCRYPVITPEGYLFDKEAVLEYILQKKKDIKRLQKDYDRQKNKDKREIEELKKAAEASRIQKFAENEKAVGAKALSSQASASTSTAGLSNMADGKDKQLPSFWLPNLTPSAKETALTKPDDKVRCPMTGKPLKMKDFITVNFKQLKDDSKKSLIAKQVRYVCAVTGDVLGNSVPCAVLRTSGNIVTMDCVERLIKKDMIDPTNGQKLTDKDIIPLQRGATGFSGAGVELQAEKLRPALMA